MNQSVAIVGASADRRKFGNKSVRAHQRAGWTVYPVNPKAQTIEGLKCRPSIRDVPAGVDRISMYVPPDVGRAMLAEIADRRPGEVYFNPGSDDPQLLAAARAAGLHVGAACSIVDVGFTPGDFPDE